MLKFFCNRSQKPAKTPWQVFYSQRIVDSWLASNFPLILLITSALHSPQERTYHRNRVLGRLYGITFLPLGRFEELLCCDENDYINDAASCGLMRHCASSWCKEIGYFVALEWEFSLRIYVYWRRASAWMVADKCAFGGEHTRVCSPPNKENSLWEILKELCNFIPSAGHYYLKVKTSATWD